MKLTIRNTKNKKRVVIVSHGNSYHVHLDRLDLRRTKLKTSMTLDEAMKTAQAYVK